MIFKVSASRISQKEKVSCCGQLWLIFFTDIFKKLFLDVHFLGLSDFVRFIKYLIFIYQTPFCNSLLYFLFHIRLLYSQLYSCLEKEFSLLTKISYYLTFAFRLLKSLVPFKMERNLFLCCLHFFQFSDVRDLLNSFRSLDLTIISFFVFIRSESIHSVLKDFKICFKGQIN